MKKLLLIAFLSLSTLSCNKDRYIFTLKTIKLNSYKNHDLPSQNLYIKVADLDNANNILATTNVYPSKYTLPASFGIAPLRLHLYKEGIDIQLWGDSTGFIASSKLHMADYKIIYPIDMEVEGEEANFSAMGKWE